MIFSSLSGGQSSVLFLGGLVLNFDFLSDRQLEQEMETVVKVLQPGPLGIIEHKFSAKEIQEANATVRRAVENWQRNAKSEQYGILKDYINH